MCQNGTDWQPVQAVHSLSSYGSWDRPQPYSNTNLNYITSENGWIDRWMNNWIDGYVPVHVYLQVGGTRAGSSVTAVSKLSYS